MVYEGIMKVRNKSMFGFSAENNAVQQIEALQHDLPEVIEEFQLLRTDKIGNEFETQFLVRYKGQDRDDIYHQAEATGSNAIMNFSMQFETFC